MLADARLSQPGDDAAAAVAIVQRHLAAVASGDPRRMAADYADAALIERAGERMAGRAAIEAYFATVPRRLRDGRLEQVLLGAEDGQVVVRWRISGGPADGTSGVDRYTVAGRQIANQIVALDGSDF